MTPRIALSTPQFAVFAAIVASTAILHTAAHAETGAQRWHVGRHYRELPPRSAEYDHSRVRVVEFFLYSCPHCNALQPLLRSWDKRRPGHVSLVYVPIIWGRNSAGDAKLFYTLQFLDRLDLHQSVYDTIHIQHKPLSAPFDVQSTELIQRSWLATKGVSPEAFKRAYSSPEVSARLSLAKELDMTYQITESPSLVVGGRYVTDPRRVTDNEELIELLDFLVSKVVVENHIRPQ